MTGWIGPSQEEIDPDAIVCISADIAREHMILPLRIEGDVLVVCVADPLDVEIVDKLCFVLNRPVAVVGAPLSQLKSAIWRLYGPGR